MGLFSRELSSFVHSAKRAGFTATERRQTAADFTEGKESAVFSGLMDEQGGVINHAAVAAVLRRVCGQGEVKGGSEPDRRALHQLGRTILAYRADKGDSKKELDFQDKKYLDLLTVFLEDFFYSTRWAELARAGEHGILAELCLVANALAKIKLNRDNGRLRNFGGRKIISNVFSLRNLSRNKAGMIAGRLDWSEPGAPPDEAAREAAVEDLLRLSLVELRQAVLSDRGRRYFVQRIAHDKDRMANGMTASRQPALPNGSINPGKDLYFFKDCLVAADALARGVNVWLIGRNLFNLYQSKRAQRLDPLPSYNFLEGKFSLKQVNPGLGMTHINPFTFLVAAVMAEHSFDKLARFEAKAQRRAAGGEAPAE